MADVSTVLHIRLDEMDPMSLEELARWHERARVRSEQQES